VAVRAGDVALLGLGLSPPALSESIFVDFGCVSGGILVIFGRCFGVCAISEKRGFVYTKHHLGRSGGAPIPRLPVDLLGPRVWNGMLLVFVYFGVSPRCLEELLGLLGAPVDAVWALPGRATATYNGTDLAKGGR
jgi:hypothetical protein